MLRAWYVFWEDPKKRKKVAFERKAAKTQKLLLKSGYRVTIWKSKVKGIRNPKGKVIRKEDKKFRVIIVKGFC